MIAPEVGAFQQANTSATPWRAFAHRSLMLAQLDLRPILPMVRHPVLLIRGDQDTVISQAAAEELAAELPHADEVEFAGAGHTPQYTHPALLAESLRRFLLPPCGLPAL